MDLLNLLISKWGNNVVIYSRVSEYSKNNLENQVRLLTYFATDNGLDIVGTFEEERTGRCITIEDLGCTELGCALDMCKLQGCSLLIYEVSRMARYHPLFKEIMMCIDNKLIVESIVRCSDFTLEDYISHLDDESVFADREWQTISKRSKDGMRSTVTIQRRVNNLTPDKISKGHDTQSRVAAEHRALLIPRIESMMSYGYNPEYIAYLLNKEGLKTLRGKDFSSSSVRYFINKYMK